MARAGLSGPDPVVRWTVDCWTAGCGWSRVGFDASDLTYAAELHRKERHNDDDE